MIIIETGEIPFNDFIIVPLLAINQLLIILIEWFCLFLRRKFKIWEPNPDDPNMQKTKTSNIGK